MKNIKGVYSLPFTVYSLVALLLIAPAVLYGQDQATENAQPAQQANQPVKNTFEYGVAINNQTVDALSKNTLAFIIQHRFGIIDNSYDMYGIYAPANIRLGLDYGITSRLTIGVGATKEKSLYDLEWKYVLLRQEKPKGIPVTVTYYGDLARSGVQSDATFLDQDSSYKGSNRLSYFNELMIARKVSNRLSLQVGVTYTHYNIVDSSATSQITDHDFFGGAFVARYKFSPQSSVMVDCNMPFKQRSFVTSVTSGTGANESVDVTTNHLPRINLGLGYECSTGSHQFQVFICTADAIINQEIAVYNTNNISDRSILVGFNITRQWGLK